MSRKPDVTTDEQAIPEIKSRLVSRNAYSRLKQYAGAWLSATISLLLLILTVADASRWIGVSQYRSIGSSRTYTILILRVLSELTTTMLGLTLTLTIERVQWHQIVRKNGQPFLNFLGLSPSTGVLGLAKISFSKGPFKASWRWWSVSRLLLLTTLPILNVVLFGSVHTRLSYHTETTRSGAFNMGMSDFNATVAQNLAQIAGSIMGIDFQDFLSDSRMAVDITPSPEDIIPCTLGISKSSSQTCNQVFYMPGTYGDLDLLKSESMPYADLVVVHDMRGYQLQFDTPKGNASVEFDLKNECDVYGYDMAAFQICFQDNEDSIAIRINACNNLTNLTKSACLSDTDWRRLPGVSSTLTINARRGTVGFSRLNSTIQTYKLANDIQRTNITAAQLSLAFHGFFTGRGRNQADDPLSEWTTLLNSLTGSLTTQVNMAPVFIAVYFAIGPSLYGTHNLAARNTLALNSLVAKLLWWCSTPSTTSIPAIGTDPSAIPTNLTSTLQNGIESGGQATYSLATSTHELVVSPGTIVAYGVLGALVLIFCTVALLLSMGFAGETTFPPHTTAFPDLDYRRLDFGGLERVGRGERVGLGDERVMRGCVGL